MQDEHDSWYCKEDGGPVSGPLDARALLARVEAGSVQAETEVSRDGKTWRPAVAWPELGFDCFLLQTAGGLNVVGPFPRSHLDRPEVRADAGEGAALFVRTSPEAASGAAALGRTGAELVRRAAAAEAALRASETARREAEAALKAKDLEFEAERQRLAAEASALKAAEMKLRAELEGARAESERREAFEKRGLDAEARLVDAEARLAEAEKKAAVQESALRAAQGLAESSGRDVAALREKLAASESALADARAKVSEATGRTNRAEADARAARETVDWIRARFSDLAAEAARRMDARPKTEPVGAGPEPVSAEPVEAEVVDADPVEETPPPRRSRGGKAVAARDAGETPSEKPLSGMAALENQLKRELRMMAGGGESGAPRSGRGSRGGFIRLFQKRD